MKKELIKYLLIITGCSMLLFFIWFRFIRPRIPKVIPFNLSLLGFIILLYICCIYLYVVISLLRGKFSSNQIINDLIDFIYKPLITFDIFIKSLPFIEPIYKRFMIYLAYKLDYAVIETNYYYYIVTIFPRIILVSTLCIDTFYFHKLELLYKVILVGIFLLLNRYIIYSFKSLKETLLSELELLLNEGKVGVYYTDELYAIGKREYRNSPNYDKNDEEEYEDEEPPGVIFITLRNFIEYQCDTYDEPEYMLYSSKLCLSIYYKQHNIVESSNFVAWDILKVIQLSLKQKMKDLIKVSFIIEYYNLSNNYDKTAARIKIVVFSLYLLCWSYILYKSIHTLDIVWIINILKASTIPDNIWIYITDV